MIKPLAVCCAGLDVHQASVVATLLFQQTDGEYAMEIKEFKTFHQDLEALSSWLEGFHPELVVMESTSIYWMPVYEVLEQAEFEVYVVNAAHVKNVPGRKTDTEDSQWLAELACCGLLKNSFIPKKDFRQLRRLTRYRRKRSSMLASEKNRLHKILESCGIKLSIVVSNIDGVSARLMIEALIEGTLKPDQIAQLALGKLSKKRTLLVEALQHRLSDRHRFLLKQIQSHLRWIEKQTAQIDEQVVTAMVPYQEQYQLLQTIPGIDHLAAAMLLTELTTDLGAFKNSEHFCSWAGMCPGNHKTANKQKRGQIRKSNRYLKTLLCECANSAAKSNSQFKSLYQSLVASRGHKRAIVAIGHKMLRIIYAILHTKKPYIDPEIDYEALRIQKNAPRWIRALKKYGYWPEQKQLN